MTSLGPYRESVLPENPRLSWRRLAAMQALLLPALLLAAALAIGSVYALQTEWNDSWRFGTEIGLAIACPFGFLLLVPAFVAVHWFKEARAWMHPGLRRSVGWSWTIATALTLVSLAVFGLVYLRPVAPPPAGNGYVLDLWHGC